VSRQFVVMKFMLHAMSYLDMVLENLFIGVMMVLHLSSLILTLV